MTLDERIEEYWGWIAAALFLLITVDLLTTLYAAAVVGIYAEANPVTRWLVARGPVALVAVNLAAVGLVGLLFYGLMELVRVTPDRLRGPFMWLIELWLGVLLAAGLAVFANNLAVIVTGRSLL
ncbi:MAG: DUF5658 family protein [Halobacteriales archaeon]|nr:DUF5658 family protein [Halobacteriales archaeon]